jgi:putative multiple sugar transport system substrate-binding protein
LYDKPALEAQFTKAGLASKFIYSDNDIETELSCVQTAIAESYDILIIAVANSDQSLAAVETAKAAGLYVVLYDRYVTGSTSADCYVSFDNVEIGHMQGKFLVDKAAEDPSSENLALYLYAGHMSDENSKRFFSGAWAELQPKIADGTFDIINSDKANLYKNILLLTNDQINEIVSEKSTEWNPAIAEAMAQDDIDSFTPTGLVYILAPNDTTSRAIGTKFRDAGNSIINTGQDGEIASLQAILDGDQSMTLLKSSTSISEALEPIFDSLIEGNLPVFTKTLNNGSVDLPFAWTVPRLLASAEDLQECVDLGLINADDLDWDN